MTNSKTLLTSLLMAILLVSCGKETVTQRTSLTRRGVVSLTASCPLKFSQAGLCANIQWVNGPSADQESSFQVTFWNAGNGSAQGPWVDPSAQVGAFIRMTCCGSVFFPKVTKVETGKYLVSGVKFTPGKWQVYVQLKNGNNTEKQFILVNLDE
jgi:hypothetical protein